ncbi:hypothetical protein CONPUDRAFT_137514 [Coniophora puteana RWD-64-598 SS2]|uniref:Actin-like ATPase domain-containing protein n=1 Tax=Coniophora puteana (strain RWD-64-598) TaxID=741705 RepID=A0A5M3MLT4_CONPW|nr:uncharacterized protein CONPUDRAFT_137514 [Coniophora puteana RWD-64-598 SS2]EIW80189.1 hypothetical protein CONPUDRAFT_137514 [Coniophora puteana RWD-64-598 SS2]
MTPNDTIRAQFGYQGPSTILNPLKPSSGPYIVVRSLTKFGEKHHGPTRRLVLAFDVGTSQGSISYCILDPGDVPWIRNVYRYPAQEHVGGHLKVPSILYYDRNGIARAIGDEVLQESIMDEAEAEGWVKVEMWKAYLQPENVASRELTDMTLPPLPFGKTVTEILGDFLRYLFACATAYIHRTHNDVTTWMLCDTNFVITIHNGWDSRTAQFRQAVVLAGLVGKSPQDQQRVNFVTKGEAKTWFCLEIDAQKASLDQGVILIDAGKETVDLSTVYMCNNVIEDLLPLCRLHQGSTHVKKRAGIFLRDKLGASKYCAEDSIHSMTESFGKIALWRFSDSSEPLYVKFGTIRDNDTAFNIRSGQLKLKGTDVAALFEPSVGSIAGAIRELRKGTMKHISNVFLLGEFAASDWLFQSLNKVLEDDGLFVYRPDRYFSNSAANGAVAFYLDNIRAKTASFTYGIRCAITYDKDDPAHITRENTLISRPSGRASLVNVFSPVVTKGTRVPEYKEFRKEFIVESTPQSTFTIISTDVVYYHGENPNPRWIDLEPEKFKSLCTLKVDRSLIPRTVVPKQSVDDAPCYRQEFCLVLILGIGESKAQISWMENDSERRTPITLVLDHDIDEK